MARLLIELALIVIVLGGAGVGAIVVLRARQRAAIEVRRVRSVEEAETRVAERKAREAAAWAAEYDTVRHRLEKEDR